MHMHMVWSPPFQGLFILCTITISKIMLCWKMLDLPAGMTSDEGNCNAASLVNNKILSKWNFDVAIIIGYHTRVFKSACQLFLLIILLYPKKLAAHIYIWEYNRIPIGKVPPTTSSLPTFAPSKLIKLYTLRLDQKQNPLFILGFSCIKPTHRRFLWQHLCPMQYFFHFNNMSALY